jgi:CelD/BcsL family acetyltransferase involved in cellulose biosynthesis
MTRTAPWIEIHSRIDAIAAEWDALAERVGASPFRRPGWLAPWLRAFGGPGEPRIFGARRDGELVGVLPLVRRGATLASPTNWHTPEFGLVAADEEAAAALAAAVLADEPRQASLAFLDRACGDVGHFRAAADAAGYLLHERTLERSPYVEIGDDWDAYLQTIRKHRRDNRRRRLRRLGELGEVTFEADVPPGRLDELLAEGFAVEGSGWKRERGTAIVSRPETLAFYTEIAHWAHERGWLRLYFLRVGGRPIAFELGIVCNGTAWDLKGGYDTEFRTHAPGFLLTFEILAELFAQRASVYEMGGADEAFKLEFTPCVRERGALEVFARSPVGAAGWVARSYARPLAKRAAAVVRR